MNLLHLLSPINKDMELQPAKKFSVHLPYGKKNDGIWILFSIIGNYPFMKSHEFSLNILNGHVPKVC